MLKKKICIIIFAIIILIQCTTVVFANEEDEEELNYFNEIQEELKQVSADISKEPQISSRAAVVIDRNSKKVIYGKNENEKRAMASTTKIMTAIILLENEDLSKTVEVSKKAANTGGSRLGLSTGNKITLNDLLYGLMLCSGNDAAVQIAETVGGSVEDFAVLMNNKAKELGLNNTHFVTPHGLDEQEHYTTAYELALLTDYALKNEKFAEVVSTKTYTVNINGNYKTLNNTNELLGYLEGVNGVKTGFTNNALRCLVTSTSRDNLNIITVVLGADTKKIRTKDSIQLIEYTYSNYKLINIKEKIENEFSNWKKHYKPVINKGVTQNLSIALGEQNYEMYPIKKEDEGRLEITINTEKLFEAPVLENSKIR